MKGGSRKRESGSRELGERVALTKKMEHLVKMVGKSYCRMGKELMEKLRGKNFVREEDHEAAQRKIKLKTLSWLKFI